MKKKIHVNRHRVASNTKTDAREPVLTVKTYRTNDYAHEVIIYGQDGEEAARVIYSPDKPLSCGARVWITCDGKVDLIVRGANADQRTVS